MKRRDVQRLVRQHFAPSFPELVLTGDVLARWDSEPIARGFVFDRHEAFVRLEAWAQPLFVPADDVYLSVAETLGDFWLDGEADAGEVMTEMLRRAEGDGRAFLARVSDCGSLADATSDLPEDRLDAALGAEIRAYCLVWTGRGDEAAAELDELIAASGAFEEEYEFELLVRFTRVRDALGRSDGEALALLQGWAAETASALKLG